jgi:hypothetical protein
VLLIQYRISLDAAISAPIRCKPSLPVGQQCQHRRCSEKPSTLPPKEHLYRKATPRLIKSSPSYRTPAPETHDQALRSIQAPYFPPILLHEIAQSRNREVADRALPGCTLPGAICNWRSLTADALLVD